MTCCRYCTVAGYLKEEAQIEWYGEDEAASIRALAASWRQRCKCGKKTLLSRLREVLRP